MTQRVWTVKELAKLKRLRLAGAPLSLCAYRLGRSVRSIDSRLWRSRIVVRPYCDEEERNNVKRLVHKGRTDAWIALKLGKPLRRVQYIRCLLGLKGNRSLWSTVGVGAGKRVRCVGCNKLCPLSIAPNWEKTSGWKTRRMDYTGTDVTEAHCPECFAKWGWGDVDATETVTTARPRPGDRVRINVPDEPAVHGLLATVEHLTDWGAHLVVHRSPRDYDRPGHQPRFRALWVEMSVVAVNGQAKAMGYTGSICSRCQGVRMVRVGTCERCDDCGETGGGCG